MGIYFEKAADNTLPFGWLNQVLSDNGGELEMERFCDSDGDYQRKYNVYKVKKDGKTYVLKRSDIHEVTLYQDFLQGKGFAVPKYYGSTEHNGTTWLLMEYIQGMDLRHFDWKMALSSAETLSQIQNLYWGCEIEDGRFERYWERINRRAKCLEKEPELSAAYHIFLERQKDCPRTLSNGDFLQFNGIWSDGRVYMIDWGFGGIMPYALDIARLIAHGTAGYEPGGFPFYMDEELRMAFMREHYDKLRQKPDWNRYLMDIRLAALNEYVEFLEEDLNDPQVGREEVEGEMYYKRARETAEEILESGSIFI